MNTGQPPRTAITLPKVALLALLALLRRADVTAPDQVSQGVEAS